MQSPCLALRDLVYRMATSLKWRSPNTLLEEGFPAHLLANCPSLQQLDYSVGLPSIFTKGRRVGREPPPPPLPILDIGPLASLGQLRQLTLRNAEVTDLSPLTALTRLQSLDISGTKVKDLEPLTALISLQSLDCNET